MRILGVAPGTNLSIYFYEPEGRGFESLLACQKLMMVGLAQLAEHRIVVPGVVGSSPISHPIYKIIEAGAAGLGS